MSVKNIIRSRPKSSILFGFVLVCLIITPLIFQHSRVQDFSDGVLRVLNRKITSLADARYDTRITPEDMSIEDVQERQKLPEFKTISAISRETRTPSINGARSQADFSKWTRSTQGNAANRYSSLDQITPENIGQLSIAWTYESKRAASVQATAVFDGNTLIFPDTDNKIVALHPATGKTVWTFDPQENRPATRGMTLWKNEASQSVSLFFTGNKTLFAISAKTGRPIKGFKGGKVRLDGISKVAPAVCGNTVVVALTGLSPSIQAFHAVTGRKLWTRKLAPDELPKGTGGRPSRQGGGNPWGGFSVDDERCIAYLTTGNPSPVLVGVERRGPNPGTNSVIAVSLEDGEILWRFQEVAHDLWDLDLPTAPTLTTVELDNQLVDIVATVTKAGNTLVLDRLSGKPIFDWRLKRAPTSTVPGERTASYQPAPLKPQPFARNVFDESDITDIGEENRESVLAQLAGLKTGFYATPGPKKPVAFYGLHGGAQWPGAAVDPINDALYVAASNVPSIIGLIPQSSKSLKLNHQLPGRQVYMDYCTSCHGANLRGGVGSDIANIGNRISSERIESIISNGIQAMPAIQDISASDTADLLAYLLSSTKTEASTEAFPRYRRDEYKRLYDFEGFPGAKPPWGTLTRLNLQTGLIDWQVPLGRHLNLEARGILGTGTENFGGPTATAGGLIFVSGTKDKMLHAFNANTGDLIWSHDIPFIGSAPVMTYQYEGEQYLFIPSTGSRTLHLYDDRTELGNAFIAFKLN